jgi:hypothetical protein
MAERIMTLGRQTLSTVIRGTDSVPQGDFREISLHCRFASDAINAGPPPAPKPQIRVTVSGRISPSDIDVQIIPPQGANETLLSRRRNTSTILKRSPAVDRNIAVGQSRSGVGPARFRTARFWGRDSIFETLHDHRWVIENPLPVDPSDPVDPFPPSGGGGWPTYVRILDPAIDIPGTWKVQVRNIGWQDIQATIMVDYPEPYRR